MAAFKNPFRLLSLLLAGLLSACSFAGGNMKASEFFTPEQVELLEAIQDGDRARAQALLDKGLTLDFYGEENITPLFWLIMQRDNRAVELALELGADPNFATPMGRTPVATVAGGIDDEVLRLLLEHGGDPNAKDADGKPALFGAIGQERWSHIKMLLEFGADMNLTDGPNRNSAHYAAFLNKFEIVHYLIEKGVDYTNRNAAGGDIAWIVHEGLSENLLSPEYEAYGWALKVKQQLINRGVEFPPPSPKEVRANWAQKNND
jgi:hypothetical protein